MTTTALSIATRVAVDILVDPTSVRWPVSELARFFNIVQRNIALHRPDAMATNGAVALVAGTKQSLAATAMKLIDFHKNTAGNKRSVTRVPMGLLDEQVPGWHNLTGVTEIVHFMYDERDPTAFYVYPPAASSGASLDGLWAAKPTDITVPASGTYADITGNCSLPDQFDNAMANGIAALCYMKDSEYSSNVARAELHGKLYASDLGMEFEATKLVAPVTAGNLRPSKQA